MKSELLAIMVAPVLMLAWAIPAGADTTRAECEFRHHGDNKQQDSGPCEFSQRQGYVTIRLHSGKEFQLKPGDKPKHYHDQHGDTVVVKQVSAASSTYKWDHKAIVVHWQRDGGQQHHQGRHSDAPPGLQDMMGYSAKSMDSEMERRGYRYRKGWADGDTKYSTWQEQENGTCVAVGVGNGRIVTIAYAADHECRR